MRILVTGGTGFIGSHLVEHLLAVTDWDVVVLDGLTYAGDIARLTSQQGFDARRVKVLWHDLRAPIGEALDRRIGDINYVVNMASDSHVDRSITDPRGVWSNNTALMLNLLEWWRGRDAKPQAFVQVSTDEVYGSCDEGGFAEWAPIVPSNPYSASKAAQEALCIAYWRTYGLPLILTNTMNNFGERQHPEKLVPKAIRLLAVGRPVPVHADGDRIGSRYWLHARNHADAVVWLLLRVGVQMYPEYDRPLRVNVVGEDELSNLDVVQMVADVMGVEARFQMVDAHKARPGHDLRYGLDGSYLRSLGWKPSVSLDESFARCVRWTLEHPEWDVSRET